MALTLIRQTLKTPYDDWRVLTFDPDPRDSSPIYMQLSRRLAQLIREGRHKPDEALPSERLLAETLNVSRVTARSAIDQLVNQG